jgi:hexulose-6-phosphate isomerase
VRIGIMQGRLVPPVGGRIQCFPRENWAEEFPLAAQAGLQCVQWIYDEYGAEANPLATDAGVRQVQALCTQHAVSVDSLCADYFMDRPLVRGSAGELAERLEDLLWLLRRAAALGVGRMVLPFVDASRLADEADADTVVQVLEQALPTAEEAGVELHLETSLAPEPLARLVHRLPHPMLRVNYDSGNSASLGYDVNEEFAAYGDRVGSVHLKDRVCGGGTVPLGGGDVDFTALFGCLRRIGYSGDYVLQVARGEPGDELAWARQNRDFIMAYLAPEGE